MPPRKFSLRLYKHLGDLDETRGYEPWLYRVTVNVCRDIARGRRRSIGLAEVPDPVAPQPDAYHDAERAQQREIVRRGLSRLGEKERAALVLRDVEGLSTREVDRPSAGVARCGRPVHAGSGRHSGFF